MKNLNKRTKMLAAILGGVVVVVVLVFAIFQPPLNEMFGTTTAQISPFSSTITEKQTVALKMTTGTNCNWTKANNNIAFVNNVTTGNSVTVQGVMVGTTNVVANCTGVQGTGAVKVNPAPTSTPKPPLAIDPLNPRVHPDKYDYQYTQLLKAVNASGSCTWSNNNDQIGWALANGGYQIYILYEKIPITVIVTVKCGTETATSSVTYTWSY